MLEQHLGHNSGPAEKYHKHLYNNTYNNYTEMVVNDKATVALAGDDPVSIDKNWTFHGAAKLTASQRVTIASGAKMIFGAD